LYAGNDGFGARAEASYDVLLTQRLVLQPRLEAAGYTVERQLDLASREISDKALQQGDIDIKPEYLGSELLFLDPSAQASGDPAAEAASLAPLLKEKDGAVLLDYSQANDTNSFVVTAETAETYGLVTVSDLAKPAS